MKISKKLIAIICAAVLVVGGVTTGIIVGCSHNSSSSDSDKEQKYDPETRALTMSISTPDGVSAARLLAIGVLIDAVYP